MTKYKRYHPNSYSRIRTGLALAEAYALRVLVSYCTFAHII